MTVETENWLEPEQALTRFAGVNVSLLGDEESEAVVTKHRFGFMLGNIGILIPEHSLSEVVKTFRIYPLPNTQPWLQGLANLRGNLIPVYDLALLLGLSETPMEQGSHHLLVLEKGSNSVGILIDNLPKSRDTTHWHSLSHTPRLPGGLTEYIYEVYAVDEVVWISFDHVGFFRSIKEKVAR